MGAILNLESFDEQPNDTPASEVPAATYEEGYTEGYATALAEQTELQGRLRESLVQSLSDSAFSYQEAQAHFLSGMTSYLETILEVILPATLTPALHAKISAILMDSFERDARAPVTLRVSPEQIEAVGCVISNLGMTHVTLSGADDLTTHAAFVVSQGRELSLDLDAALSAIRSHSEILLQTSQEVS